MGSFMPKPEVSKLSRTLQLELTPENAKALIENFDRSKEPNGQGKVLMSALVKIANGQE